MTETIEHRCEAMQSRAYSGHGPAIEDIWLDDKIGWVAGNTEYASAIEFCPFCGEKLILPK